jgi:Ser/Thr protein kinase RdoA (MazF antagonist)
VTPELRARSVLASYGLEDAPLTRLGGADNTNFRVDTPEPYALRLRKPGGSDRVTMASELAWLGRLQTDTSLVVPEPVVNTSGELITGIAFAGEAETLATLTRWVKGTTPPTTDALSHEQLTSAGAVMAHLHRHARQFSPPEWFERARYGNAYFRRRARALFSALSGSNLKGEELSRLEARAEHVITRFAGLERTPERFGLIHADFHSGNYVLFGAEVRIIDFDRCGFGFYLFDLALALMELGEPRRERFLQGYRAVAPLPPNYSGLLQGFLCLAYLDNLGFHAPNPEELPFIVNELPFVSEALHKVAEDFP